MSTTIPMQVRVDIDTKREASELFKDLGLDMSGAINMFLKQCIITNSIPFRIKRSRYSKELDEAMEEAERIASDPDAETYKTFEDYQVAMKKLMEEDE